MTAKDAQRPPLFADESFHSVRRADDTNMDVVISSTSAIIYGTFLHL